MVGSLLGYLLSVDTRLWRHVEFSYTVGVDSDHAFRWRNVGVQTPLLMVGLYDLEKSYTATILYLASECSQASRYATRRRRSTGSNVDTESYYDSPYKKILEQNFPQSNGGRIAVALPFRDFYFHALRSLVVLSFPQLVSFSSVLSKPLKPSQGARTGGFPFS
jgi:hypothetical protein